MISPLEQTSRELREILDCFVKEFTPEVFDKIYARLLVLTDPQDWEDEDLLPNMDSFRSLLEYLIDEPHPVPHPSIFVDRFGIFSAVWCSSLETSGFSVIFGSKTRWLSDQITAVQKAFDALAPWEQEAILVEIDRTEYS